MNTDIMAILTETLRKSVETAEQAGRFIVGELPDIAQQYLAYELAFSLLWCLICIIGIPIGIYFGVKIIKWGYDYDCEPVCILPFGLSLALTVALVINMFTALKIYMAPKIYLMEFIAKLIHK